MSSPNDLTLETPRLRLRRFRAADVDWAAQLDADAEVMRFISGGVPTPSDVFHG